MAAVTKPLYKVHTIPMGTTSVKTSPSMKSSVPKPTPVEVVTAVISTTIEDTAAIVRPVIPIIGDTVAVTVNLGEPLCSY